MLLHAEVTLPVAISIVLAYLRIRYALLFTLWSLVLMVTVLTTGQHVLLDMLYGVAVGTVSGAATILSYRLGVDLRTMGALLLEWLCITVALRLALYLADWRSYCAAFVIIATRQHALFILYHDATHYHLTRRRHANDYLTNLAIGVPALVPIEFYRPLHLQHHQHTGTEHDPERQFLYHQQPWNFRPLGTGLLLRQLLGDLLILNTVRNLRAYKAAGGAPLRPTSAMKAAAVTWLAILALLTWQCSAHTLNILAMLWFLPMATVGNLLQKIRSMAEHSGGPGTTPGWHAWTYAWQVGWVGRFFVWPYHINLHLQHHRSANIPWHALPEAVSAEDRLLTSTTLGALLWSRLQGTR